MLITKQELKKRLNGCQSVGEINAILQAAGLPDEAELSDEVASFVEAVYSLFKQGIPLSQAIEYTKTGNIPQPEIDIDSLLTGQMQFGADYQNQTEAQILHENVSNSAKQYLKAYYSLFAAAVNSQVILEDPEVVEVREAAKRMIVGDRVGSGGRNFLQQAVIGAASKNLLPQLQPVKAALLPKQLGTK